MCLLIGSESPNRWPDWVQAGRIHLRQNKGDRSLLNTVKLVLDFFQIFFSRKTWSFPLRIRHSKFIFPSFSLADLRNLNPKLTVGKTFNILQTFIEYILSARHSSRFFGLMNKTNVTFLVKFPFWQKKPVNHPDLGLRTLIYTSKLPEMPEGRNWDTRYFLNGSGCEVKHEDWSEVFLRSN